MCIARAAVCITPPCERTWSATLVRSSRGNANRRGSGGGAARGAGEGIAAAAGTGMGIPRRCSCTAIRSFLICQRKKRAANANVEFGLFCVGGGQAHVAFLPEKGTSQVRRDCNPTLLSLRLKKKCICGVSVLKKKKDLSAARRYEPKMRDVNQEAPCRAAAHLVLLPVGSTGTVGM